MPLSDHNRQDDLVSIIIPCFNGEAFIAEAIESTLCQSHLNIEVIVVDDGSTDGSWDIIQSFSSQIRCYTIPHQGAPVARNYGINKSRGAYLQFLDADDFMLEEKVERCLAAFEDDIDVVFSDYCICDKDLALDTNEGFLYRSLRTFMKLSLRNGAERDSDSRSMPPGIIRNLYRTIATPLPLYRAALLKETGGFNPGLKAGQEFELNSRLLQSGAVYKEIPDKLVKIRVHEGVDRISNNPQSIQYRMNALDMVRESLLNSPDNTVAVRQALSMRYISNAASAIELGSPSLADQLYQKALQLNGSPQDKYALFDFLTRLLGFHRACRVRAKVLTMLR